ncbi:AP2-like ethylene-responsive transcription factor AIL5 [Hibiscus syriacus]|uniref:AP2-like ethylene-responsive transcription factor AIL5 n=1 Tax=Hibiscus syriacus TaxID=106335 RepID=A0A6A3B486_HIBSY|nr:AP2-like ethylene-responsive transcription factor AIL5 [Hibiscus syriacus]
MHMLDTENAVSIPFNWEMMPGTPKHPRPETLPPLIKPCPAVESQTLVIPAFAADHMAVTSCFWIKPRKNHRRDKRVIKGNHKGYRGCSQSGNDDITSNGQGSNEPESFEFPDVIVNPSSDHSRSCSSSSSASTSSYNSNNGSSNPSSLRSCCSLSSFGISTHIIKMDYSSSTRHHHHHQLLSSPSNYRLFQAAEKDGGGEGPGSTSAGATDSSVFKGGPKLEDFLGGSPQPHPPLPHNTPDLYDSELKIIAANFLREQQQQQVPTAADHAPKRAVDTFGQRTSIFRGVTRHRWTGRYEAHLWDNSCRREGQSRKGRQDFRFHFLFFELGGYDKEDKAARAYDLAALKYWGPTTITNFPISNYEKELADMKNMTRQEFVASLRRKSSGFSRGASIYRGVTRHHQHGRWQARIGRVAGNKDLYLGTFSTQEEAAEAYDIAAIKFRGLNAVTNFDMSRYDVKSIANSNLPIGGLGNKSINCSDSASDSKSNDEDRDHSVSSSGIAIPIKQDSSNYWSNVFGFSNTATSLSTAKNTSMLHQPSNNGYGFTSPSGYSLSYGGNSTGLLNGDGNVEQQQQKQEGVVCTNSLPFAAPIVSSNNNGDDNSSGYGNWNIEQSFHSPIKLQSQASQCSRNQFSAWNELSSSHT